MVEVKAKNQYLWFFCRPLLSLIPVRLGRLVLKKVGGAPALCAPAGRVIIVSVIVAFPFSGAVGGQEGRSTGEDSHGALTVDVVRCVLTLRSPSDRKSVV